MAKREEISRVAEEDKDAATFAETDTAIISAAMEARRRGLVGRKYLMGK
jgi:hypothetical protein